MLASAAILQTLGLADARPPAAVITCDVGDHGPGPLGGGVAAACLMNGRDFVLVAGNNQHIGCKSDHTDGAVIIVAGNNNQVDC